SKLRSRDDAGVSVVGVERRTRNMRRNIHHRQHYPQERKAGMGHYKSNVRDLEFNLFEVLGVDESLEAGDFGDMDTETAQGVLAEAANLAEGPIAESLESADRNPPVFDPDSHSVSIPEDFKKSFHAWYDSGFWSMGIPEDLGGTHAPSPMVWAVSELVLGANPAVFMYGAGPSFAGVFYKNA